MVDKKLLEVRNTLKSKKPKFKRVQSNQFAKLRNKADSWRKPKGMGNKVRRQRRGQAAMPKVGYGSPKEVRGLNREGLREVLVYNVSDLDKVNKKEEIVVIGSTVGSRKRSEIIKKAEELKLKIANVKKNNSSEVKEKENKKKEEEVKGGN
jgi:large subunit ribosomal protein L32e